MNKLFIHLFTKAMEHYQDTQGSLREIDAILDKDEEILYLELQEAIQQAHRIRVLRQNGIGLTYDDIGSSISISNEKDNALESIYDVQVTIPQLKKFIESQIKERQNE